MKKQLISQALESHLSELVSMSDQIYDFAEPGMEEIQSSRLLTEYLKAKGFEVECGIAGLPTAFRAVYEQGSGGPSFGFLAEYDAIKDIGHACGHHMQGPVGDRSRSGHFVMYAVKSRIRSSFTERLQRRRSAERSS